MSGMKMQVTSSHDCLTSKLQLTTFYYHLPIVFDVVKRRKIKL